MIPFPVGAVPAQEGVVPVALDVEVEQENVSPSTRELTVFLFAMTPLQTFHTYHTPSFHFELQYVLSMILVLFDCQTESL